ncbi:hypothetical protein FB451DRAFT_1408506 [Mycena latifolia]|nr:hypothetical protein FB451DRAFT_1408506 [Mycena latifolia]
MEFPTGVPVPDHKSRQQHGIALKELRPVTDIDLDSNKKDSEADIEVLPSARSGSDEFPDGGFKAWTVAFGEFMQGILDVLLYVHIHSLAIWNATTAITHWWKKKRGLAFGIATPGSAAGGVFFPRVMRELLDDLRFTWICRIMGFLYRHFHAWHHRLYAPYAYANSYNHPLEGLIMDAALVFFFPLLKAVDDHYVDDIHHQIGMKYDFPAPFFVHWDHLMGTRMTRRDLELWRQENKEERGE